MLLAAGHDSLSGGGCSGAPVTAGGASMHRLSAPGRVRVRRFLDRPDHPHPHRLAVEIPGFEALVGLLGGEHRRILTVLLDEQVTRVHIRDMQLRLSW